VERAGLGRRHAQLGSAFPQGQGRKGTREAAYSSRQPRKKIGDARHLETRRQRIARELALKSDVMIENYKVGGWPSTGSRTRT